MRPPNWQKIDTLPVSAIQVEERLRTASPTAVASIVSSIQEVGCILQPLLVRKVKGGYRLMDGLHRLCAAKEIGLEDVPVSVSDCIVVVPKLSARSFSFSPLNVMEAQGSYHSLEHSTAVRRARSYWNGNAPCI